MPIDNQTRPTSEQLLFRSANSGDHILDSYLESAEIGGRTLPDLLSDIFETDGQFAASNFQFRIEPTTRKYQVRVGVFADNSTAWTDIPAGYVFRQRGVHATSTAYEQLDCVTYNNSTYVCTTAHTSNTATPNSSNFSVILDGTALNTATSAAAASATAAASSATASASSASSSATQATNAAASATLASDWATKTSGPVVSGGFSAKYNANLAETSATIAAASASTSNTKASEASTSATNAAASASAASTSATNAAGSATAAANSATTASTQASTATTQAGVATTQAASASSSASAAATSATNAASSATAAASSASTASTQASNAATSATNAASSATAAANSATASASSATSSASSATSSANSFSSMDVRYLGSKSADPTLNNSGAALAAGALYFNTSVNAMKVYSGSAWLTAYVPTTGLLSVSNNLSDVASAATARTNLGLAIGSDVQAWDADLDAIAALAGTSGFLKKTAANTWSLDTSTYLTGNQSITFTGDATGSGATSVALTLANSGVTAGTYGGNNSTPSFTIDAKGRITSATAVTPSGTWGISISGNAATATTATTATTANALNTANSYTVAGLSIASSPISTGASAGFQFNDRVTGTNYWTWYSTSNVAYLYSGISGAVGNKLSIDSAGNVIASGYGNFTGQSGAAFTGTSTMGVNIKGSTTTTDYTGITFYGNNATATPYGKIAMLSTGSGSYLYFGTSNNYASGVTNASYIDYGGNFVAAGNVTAYSDPRLKENFERVADPLAILSKLDGGTFTWKRGIEHISAKAGKRDYGVLADQVEAVMPEIVTDSVEIEGQTYKTVAYEKLVPVLIEANKALLARIEALEAKSCNCQCGS